MQRKRWLIVALLASLHAHLAISPPEAPSRRSEPPPPLVTSDSEDPPTPPDAGSTTPKSLRNLIFNGSTTTLVDESPGYHSKGFSLRDCYDIRQVLVMASQVPKPNGKLHSCDELAKVAQSHPHSAAQRALVEGVAFSEKEQAARSRKWFEKTYADQLRDAIKGAPRHGSPTLNLRRLLCPGLWAEARRPCASPRR